VLTYLLRRFIFSPRYDGESKVIALTLTACSVTYFKYLSTIHVNVEVTLLLRRYFGCGFGKGVLPAETIFPRKSPEITLSQQLIGGGLLIRIPLDKVRKGMRLARAIYSADGRVLLNSGVKLKPEYIIKLRQLGYPAVYVGTEDEDYPIPEVISERTRVEAVRCVRDLFTGEKLGEGDLTPVLESVRSIVDEIVAEKEVMVSLSDIRSYDDYTFGHSVNVCALSVLIGSSFGLDQISLRELGVGAILHDIGKMMVPRSILLKPGKLSDDEFDIMKKHTKNGFEVLRQKYELSAKVCQVAYQHHERIDGSGYPRQLRGDQIILYARITGLADVYDAMTADRAYRPAFAPAKVLRLIRDLSGVEFDQDLVDVFFRHVAFYPLGSRVLLNTGEIGFVVDHNMNDRQPVVRLLYDQTGRRVEELSELDLSKENGRCIERMADDIFEEEIS